MLERSLRDERGQMVAVEAAIILPALLMIVGLVILLGRDALAEQAVGSAAASAARAASIERTPAEADAAARGTAAQTLAEANISCANQSISVNTAELNSAPGTPAVVSVTITCDVTHDVTLPGFPGTTSVVATRTSPVDTYRSR